MTPLILGAFAALPQCRPRDLAVAAAAAGLDLHTGQ
jgi:hypothetical protein